ncbi:MAG: hypothetical protein IT445_07755 [Phycisphaeraceae bacterium]|nr:hypothetical protein [Phycisphaeraceae bacterium]
MKSLLSVVGLLLVSLCIPQPLEADTEDASGTPLTGVAILDGLKTKQGEQLHEFIKFLNQSIDQSQLTNEEIGPIIEQLRVIQATDPYQKMVNAHKDPEHRKVAVFPNRRAAEPCIFTFKFQLLANDLRQLPLDQRVDKIIEGIEHPPDGFQKPKKVPGTFLPVTLFTPGGTGHSALTPTLSQGERG